MKMGDSTEQVDTTEQEGNSLGTSSEQLSSGLDVEEVPGPSKDQCREADHGDWTSLPDVTTAMVASYLLPWQRGYMAMTCTSWNRAIMQTPHLWRTKEFRIHGNWRDGQHLSYARSLGRHLKYVYFTFGFRSFRRPRRMQKLFTAILAELYRRGPVQLRELFVTSLQFHRNFHAPDTDRSRTGIMTSLNRFLRRQAMLEKLDLSDSTLLPDEGVGLLSSASEHSSASLKTMYIDDTFRPGSAVHADRSFVHVMGSFTNLVDVTLNYSCVSAGLLSGLAAACHSTLELLNISTHRQDSHDHVVGQEAWMDFRDASPGTRVKLSMSGIMPMPTVYRILSPGMPLTNLRLFGHNDGGFNPDRTLRHLARHFPNTLQAILIDVGPVYHPYGRGLESTFKKCQKLENLQIHGRIAWPTLRDVFDFVDAEYIKKGLRPRLTHFRMVITTIGFGQEEALVMEEFRPIFDQHNLKYELVFDPMYPLPLGPLVPLDAQQVFVDDEIEVV